MISKYFKIHELVPVKLVNMLHEDLLWSMLDDGIIKGLDAIKEQFPNGTITVNSYKWGGDRGWSGIRTKDSKWYSEGSMHSVGKAFDMVFSAYEVKEVKKFILENQELFPGITRIEGGDIGWLHIDCKPTGKKNIYVFYV